MEFQLTLVSPNLIDEEREEDEEDEEEGEEAGRWSKVVNVHLNAIFPADSINAGRHIGKGTAENWSGWS